MWPTSVETAVRHISTSFPIYARTVSALLFSFLVSCAVIHAQNVADQIPPNEWEPLAARLSQMLRDGSPEEQREALFQIRNLRSERASRLAVVALGSADEVTRGTAASSVIFLPPGDAAGFLIPLLNDRAEFVRRETAYALGRVGNALAVSPLAERLAKDKSLEVRAAAAVALGDIGSAASINHLVATLSSKAKEENEFLRRSAARALGQIAQKIQTGTTLVLTPQNFLPEKFKVHAAKRLDIVREYPEFTAVRDRLISILQDSRETDDTRREAAFALGAIGDKAAEPILKQQLTSPDPFMAEIAREALLKISAMPSGG